MSETTPKVSVIIPTYNRADFLPKTIASVLNQTFDDFELVVVDDGSTDNTRQVVERFRDRRIRYVFQHNQGTSGALNTGLEASTGQYIVWLGSDDTYEAEYVEAHLAFLEERPDIGLVGSGMQLVDEDGNSISIGQPWEMHPSLDLDTWLYHCPIGAAMMVRRIWLDRIGGFDANLRLVEDWDLYLRLAHAGCKMAWLERALYRALFHSGSKQIDARALGQALVAILDKFFAQPNLTPSIAAKKDKVYAHAFLKAARFGYACGEVDMAKRNLERAIERDPSLLAENGRTAFKSILEMTSSHWVEDPVAYVTTVFDNLPQSAERLSRRRDEAIALGAMTTFFDAHKKSNWRAVRRAFAQAVTHDPSCLRNRGVISIWLESVLGSRFMAYSRKLARQLRL